MVMAVRAWHNLRCPSTTSFPLSFMDPETGAALEGEEPRDASARDVEYWLSIYDVLLTFTEDMLQRTREFMREAPMPARRHLEITNVRIMEREHSPLRTRLSYV